MRARQEHEQFTRMLRSLGLDVLELPADSQLPDSVFVEDTAFVVNGKFVLPGMCFVWLLNYTFNTLDTALICRPGEASRAKEVPIFCTIWRDLLFLIFSKIYLQVDTIRSIITKEIDIPIIEITDPKAKLDGGDVLFTGLSLKPFDLPY